MNVSKRFYRPVPEGRFCRRIVASVLFFSLVAYCTTVNATPFLDPMFGVNVTYDVQYGTSPTGDGVDLPRYLDLYQPTGPGLPAELPAIVLMHGGSFVSGHKGHMAAYANAFAERGYVAVSINYRLLLQDNLPDPPGDPITIDPSRYTDSFEAQLLVWGVTVEEYCAEIAAAVADEAMAVNWVVDNADTFGIDSQKIAAGGYSAGAVSSLLLGVDAVDGAQADVGAVFSRAGGLFGLETHVDPSDPGVYILHGDQDTTVPYAEAGFLVDALSSAGVPFVLDVDEGAGHGPNLEDPSLLFNFMFEQLDLQTIVPEPSSLVIFATLGCLALIAAARRKRSADI